ncbi:MAG: flagellar biosynthesis protein FlhF [Pseudomonadota bacterium]
MNVKRFTAPTSREALAQVRLTFGEDAVVLSTKPCPEGVEVLAMAPGSVEQIERMTPPTASPTRSTLPAPVQQQQQHQPPQPQAKRRPALPQAEPAVKSAGTTAASQVWSALASAARSAVRGTERTEPSFDNSRMQAPEDAVEDDVQQLAGSSLSFQDYVRDRMLKKRETVMKAEAAAKAAEARAQSMASVNDDVERLSMSTLSFQEYARQRMLKRREEAARISADQHEAAEQAEQAERQAQKAQALQLQAQQQAARAAAEQAKPAPVRPAAARTSPPMLRDELPVLADNAVARREQLDMLNELKSMKGLIEERFGALAFMEKLQRYPTQARLTQKMLDCGFSPALIRKLTASMKPDVVDETVWAANVLERNLLTADNQPALEDEGGVFALIGSTGVGKTTTTAKIAAAFATKHGANNLGLVTLDAYRVGAHEQLRAYGRILGVPVHTAHDRASLEDLLELLSSKKMVLIDTAGMGQRDTRTRDLLEMLGHRSIHKLVVVNASAQGETIDDVLLSYRANQARGVVLSKIDEAVKLGPALDAMIRHKLCVLGVANGQRVPEDWHRLSAHAMVQRALRSTPSTAYRMDSSDVNLIFAAPHASLYANAKTPSAPTHPGRV